MELSARDMNLYNFFLYFYLEEIVHRVSTSLHQQPPKLYETSAFK